MIGEVRELATASPMASASSSSSSRKSETYRKASRSSPMLTKADCMPGSTRVTRPLYIDPASVYSFSRSKYISESWSSSTTATLVSCGVDETYNSFAMDLLRFLPAGKKLWEVQKKGQETGALRAG